MPHSTLRNVLRCGVFCRYLPRYHGGMVGTNSPKVLEVLEARTRCCQGRQLLLEKRRCCQGRQLLLEKRHGNFQRTTIDFTAGIGRQQFFQSRMLWRWCVCHAPLPPRTPGGPGLALSWGLSCTFRFICCLCLRLLSPSPSSMPVITVRSLHGFCHLDCGTKRRTKSK